MYIPELVMDPPVQDHVTDVLIAPLTEAANCCVAPGARELLEGDTATLIGVVPDPLGL